MILRGLVPAIVVNLAILIAPLWVVGRFSWDDPAVLSFLAIATALILADAPTIGRAGAAEPRLNVQDRLIHRLALATGGLILMVFWVSLLERTAVRSGAMGSVNRIGAVVMGAGVVLRAAAVRSLGDGFRTELGDGPLIDGGLYAWVRHPSETGNLAVAIGAAGLLGSGLGLLAAVVVLVPIVAVRIRIEDRDLRERFGVRFEDYANRVGALVPLRMIRSRRADSVVGAIGSTARQPERSGETGTCGLSHRGAGWGD